jgi:hypothetical protein
MKTFRNLAALGLSALLAFAPLPALAQAGPGSVNVALQPTTQPASATLSATGNYNVDLNAANSAAAVRVSALSGTLVATIQGSSDPLNIADASATWSTLYYLDATNPLAAPANSITANGFYIFNTAGFTRFRVHVTTLSGGSHVVTLQASTNIGGGVAYNLSSAPVLGAGTNNIGNVTSTQDYPLGATPLTASATGTTAATTATLAGTSGKTTYICGYSIRSSATAAVVVNDTITGVITGTLNFSNYVPANTAGVGADERNFSKCVPASATNTGIAVVSGAASTGGVTSVSAWGYQQ